MRIETLNSLTDDELAMLLYILNAEPPLPIKEVTPGIVLAYKDDALTFKVSQWHNRVKDEAKHIYDSLMFKISNVNQRSNSQDADIDPPASGPSGEASGSNNPATGSAGS